MYLTSSAHQNHINSATTKNIKTGERHIFVSNAQVLVYDSDLILIIEYQDQTEFGST
jgi:hypothetical protein